MIICVLNLLVVSAALLRNRHGRVENEWLRIRAVSFVFIYLDLMCKHQFSTFPWRFLISAALTTKISIPQMGLVSGGPEMLSNKRSLQDKG